MQEEPKAKPSRGAVCVGCVVACRVTVWLLGQGKSFVCSRMLRRAGPLLLRAFFLIGSLVAATVKRSLKTYAKRRAAAPSLTVLLT